MVPRRRPPAWHVLVAFGVERGALEQLEGGEGTSWRAGDLVLKPGLDERFATWLAGIGEQWCDERVRLATPVAATDGRLVAGGWSATPWMPGAARPGDVDALLRAAEDLHDALSRLDIAWPGFLRGRSDRWAVADRVAWGEEPPTRFGADLAGELGLTALLREACVDLPRQIVHGDLAGNVLFDDDGAPAVIDLSPYLRPASWSSAIAVADAVAWAGAPPAAAGAFVARTPHGQQLLARAIIFRVVASPDDLDAYRPLAKCALAAP